MKARHFQKGGRGVYKCGCCGRNTRYTGTQSVSSECCPQCFDLAGLYNVLQDGGQPDAAEVERLIAEVRELGGNVDHWDELIMAAREVQP